MMEVINNALVIIYKRSGEAPKSPEDDDGQFIEWEYETSLSSWPAQICRETSVPFIFSPNFNY